MCISRDIETQKTIVFMGTATGSIGGGTNASGTSGYTSSTSINNLSIPNNPNSSIQINSNNIYNTNVLDRCCFSYLQGALSPKLGMPPGMNSHGDDQLLCCYNMSMAYFDFRQGGGSKSLRSVAEWKLPQSVSSVNTNPQPSVPNVGSVYLTCSTSYEDIVVVGSSGGGIYVVDRRSGRLLCDVQAHDSSVVKVSATYLYLILLIAY